MMDSYSDWAVALCAIAFMWLVRAVYERHLAFVEAMYETGYTPAYHRIGWRVRVTWILAATPPVNLTDADVSLLAKPTETEIALRQRLSEIHSIARIAGHPSNLPDADLERIIVLSNATYHSGEMPILEPQSAGVGEPE